MENSLTVFLVYEPMGGSPVTVARVGSRGLLINVEALAVGYSDQSHLTRRFKKFMGITLGQYIREGKIRQDGTP